LAKQIAYLQVNLSESLATELLIKNNVYHPKNSYTPFTHTEIYTQDNFFL